MKRDRQQHAEQHDGRREPVHQHSALLERGEEARPDLKPDREHEQNQPEFLDEVQHMIVHAESDLSEHDSDEEHQRDAQRNAEDLHAPERNAEHDRECENQDGVSHSVHIVHKQIRQPVHMRMPL